MKSIKASYGININFIFGGINETEEWEDRMQQSWIPTHILALNLRFLQK